jgi:hypothetical protein
MSVSIYAGHFCNHPTIGRLMEPVIDFKHWDRNVLADDADERADRDEDPFIPNPDFIENAGINISGYNAKIVFDILGIFLKDEPASFPIDEVHNAAIRALNSPRSDYTEEPDASIGEGGCHMLSFGIPEGYIIQRLQNLLDIITTGRQHGATHICVA